MQRRLCYSGEVGELLHGGSLIDCKIAFDSSPRMSLQEFFVGHDAVRSLPIFMGRNIWDAFELP